MTTGAELEKLPPSGDGAGVPTAGPATEEEVKAAFIGSVLAAFQENPDNRDKAIAEILFLVSRLDSTMTGAFAMLQKGGIGGALAMFKKGIPGA